MKSKFWSVLVLCFSMFAFAVSVFAQTGVGQGTIQQIYMYGNGSIVVSGIQFSGIGCSNSHGFLIGSDNPNFARLLAVILSARSMGATLIVSAKTDNCWYPEVTQDSMHYVLLQP